MHQRRQRSSDPIGQEQVLSRLSLGNDRLRSMAPPSSRDLDLPPLMLGDGEPSPLKEQREPTWAPNLSPQISAKDLAARWLADHPPVSEPHEPQATMPDLSTRLGGQGTLSTSVGAFSTAIGSLDEVKERWAGVNPESVRKDDPSWAERMLTSVAMASVLALYDFVAYNDVVSSVNPSNQTPYRPFQASTQTLIMTWLARHVDAAAAEAFDLIWWTFGCDLAFYAMAELGPEEGWKPGWHGPGSLELVTGNQVTWAKWTPVGLLRGMSEEPIAGDTLIAQAIAGFLVATLVASSDQPVLGPMLREFLSLIRIPGVVDPKLDELYDAVAGALADMDVQVASSMTDAGWSQDMTGSLGEGRFLRAGITTSAEDTELLLGAWGETEDATVGTDLILTQGGPGVRWSGAWKHDHAVLEGQVGHDPKRGWNGRVGVKVGF